MEKLSSDGVTIATKAFMVIPLFALAVMIVVSTLSWLAGREGPLGAVILTAVFAGVFYLARKFTWNLADEVYDCGDSVLVRRGKLEDKIPLRNIVDVMNSGISRPSKVTIYLAAPSILGLKISFLPEDVGSFNPFFKSEVPKNLRDRARLERSNSTGH